MRIGIGAVVIYLLTKEDAAAANSSTLRMGRPPLSPGDKFPLLVTVVSPNGFGVDIPAVSGEVFLDEGYSAWVKNVPQGNAPGSFFPRTGP